MRFYMNQKHEKISHCAQLLETLSPLKILQRGFSITRKKSGEVITDCKQIAAGEIIVTRVSDGEIESVVF
jgi:exodeoxyribonuclease VII large subunit